MSFGEPDRVSRYVRRPDRFLLPGDSSWDWRQVLDWRGAHIVDHGGCLWIWAGDGYRWIPDMPGAPNSTVFYDLSEIYD